MEAERVTAANPRIVWARRAWLPTARAGPTSPDSGYGAWHDSVRLQIGEHGCWERVDAGVARVDGDEIVDAPVLPTLVDAHGHAFQRAFAGLAERRDSENDDFWSWRDRMYEVALTITPERLNTVATRLYRELLAGGYSHVCEFHYLHRDTDGRSYAEPATMTYALVEAARCAGIGLTLLPVVYEHAGFGGIPLRAEQRRFACDFDAALRLRDTVRAMRLPRIDAGIALHSLRAVSDITIERLADATRGDAGPIHLHVAEQTGEIDDCLRTHDRRPVEHLLARHAPDARWQLVHATHVGRAEIAAVAACGAGVVLCPTTEANLGDGVTDLTGWLAADVPLSIGSDSHVARDWPQELRCLEYGQRLVHRRRNVGAAPEQGEPSTAARLFGRMVAGSAGAAALPAWGLRVDARADLVVVNTDDPAFAEVPDGQVLDALVFGGVAQPFSRTMVAGCWVG